MPKKLKPKIISEWVDWRWDDKTNKDHFYRYTKYSDDSISGIPISQDEYLKAKDY